VKVSTSECANEKVAVARIKSAACSMETTSETGTLDILDWERSTSDPGSRYEDHGKEPMP
jgi:hypothetical protein